MKKYLTKITGTQIYHGGGDDHIDSPSERKWDKHAFDELPFDTIFDSEEYTPQTFYQLPNGLLVIRTCVGDEQTSSSLYILKDWETELIEQDVEVVDMEHLRLEYNSSPYGSKQIPRSVKTLIEEYSSSLNKNQMETRQEPAANDNAANVPTQSAQAGDAMTTDTGFSPPPVREVTVGRDVYYFSNREEDLEGNSTKPLSAKVVAVQENNVVSLQVFSNGTEGLIYRKDVKHKSAVNAEDRAESYWEWPVIK